MPRKVPPVLLIVSLSVLLFISIIVSSGTGLISISYGEVFLSFMQTLGFGVDEGAVDSRHQAILFSIRVPRVLTAALIGAGMACCGAAMQGLFRNGLADPALIGVSGGGSLGASIAILLTSSGMFGALLEPLVTAVGFDTSSWVLLDKYFVAFMAFLGGLAATLLVYRLGNSTGGLSVATMLLAGIAITALAGAFSNLCTYFANDLALRRLSIWRMGSLESSTWWDVTVCASLIGFVVCMIPRYGKALNAMLLGESEARHLGFDIVRIKRRLIALTALAMGVAVASAGVIGFVGLLVPHTVRMLIGPDHRYLIPCASLFGASLMVLADLGARTLLAPEELPVGIVTASLGAPFFIMLLLRQKRGLGV